MYKGGNLGNQKPSVLMCIVHLCSVLFLTVACQANSSSEPTAAPPPLGDGYRIANNPDNLAIIFDRAETQVRQNEYDEIELSVSGSGNSIGQLSWFVDQNEAYPPGMELQYVDDSRVLLSGYPQFVGTWCFALNVQNTNSRASARLCLNSVEDQNYPLKFKNKQELLSAKANQHYSQQIPYEFYSDRNQQVSGQIYTGEVSPYQVQFQNSTKRFLVIGQTSEVGLKTFSLRLWTQGSDQNSDSEFYEVYKQFNLNVVGEEGNQYACAPGYYYSETLNYCVQAQGSSACDPGYFYNPDSNSCVTYAQPPRHITCSYNEIFDSYLGQCVLQSYPRCPLNYTWNSYQYRCDRLPYTCPVGTYYSYSTNSCELIWQRTCGFNQYWDNYAGRCRTNVRYCPIGSYWNPVWDRCEVSSYRCDRNDFWDWGHNRCERYSTPSCGFNEYYDFNRRYCVRREIERSCGGRERWSPIDRRCLPWVTPDPVRPRPRPRPEPIRPPPVRPEPVRPGPVRPRPEPVRPAPPRPEPVRPAPPPRVEPAPSRPAPTPAPSRPAPGNPERPPRFRP